MARPRHAIDGRINRRDGVIELRRPARNHLAESEWGCVLQMRSADHHDARELPGFRCKGVAQRPNGGEELMGHLFDGGNVHHGRERVVGGLAMINVVVRMDRLLRAHHAAGELDRAIGDDLVGVHVGLGAGAGLEDDKRETRRPTCRR